ADVDGLFGLGARRPQAQLEDPRIGFRDTDHAGIDDELEMRGEPGFVERSLRRAVGVRVDSDHKPHVTRALESLPGCAVRSMTQPDRDVEATPPFRDRAPLRFVGDADVLHQVAEVASLACALASRVRRSLGVETNPRATLGLHHGRLAEIPASRYQVL